jgi:hypothetical protein
LDAFHHKRLLNREKCRDDVVVHLNDKVKTASPASVGLHLCEKRIGALRHRNIKNLEVFDFTQVAHEDWVEVNADKAFFSLISLLTHEKVFVKLVFGILLYTSFPLVDLGRIKLVKVFSKGVEKLDHIFVLFSVLEGLGEALKALHWVLDTLVETCGPVDGSRNGRHVAGDRGVLVHLIDKYASLLENLTNNLQVLLV